MEDFVPFEIAKKLKEKGFRIPTKNIIAMYNELGVLHPLTTSADYVECASGTKYRCYYNYDDFDEYDYPAPTISQVLKWLREEKEIHISTDITGAGWINNIVIKVKYIEDGPYWYSKKYRETEFYNSYEEAVIEAIEYVLDNLI